MPIGYKIMTLLEDGLIHSMADRRITLPLQPTILQSPSGIWLGTTIEYVQQYYGSSNPDEPEEMNPGEYEVRCTFEYLSKDIIRGTASEQGLIDPGSEFAVKLLRLISVYNVTIKQIIF